MVCSISKHNPLFPPSPTANTPSDSLSAQLDGHDGPTAMMATPEPYFCAPDVEMPSAVPSLMHIVAHLMLEVGLTAASCHAVLTAGPVLVCVCWFLSNIRGEVVVTVCFGVRMVPAEALVVVQCPRSSQVGRCEIILSTEYLHHTCL